MLILFLEPGQHALTIQFSTMRQTQSEFTNKYHPSAAWEGLSAISSDKQKLHFTNCPTQGPWYIKFIQGCHHCMGNIVKQNMALSIRVMLELDRLITTVLCDVRTWQDTSAVFQLTQAGCWATMSFVDALHGKELPQSDLFGTHRHFSAVSQENLPHVTLALLDHFKGETGLNYHLVPMPT